MGALAGACVSEGDAGEMLPVEENVVRQYVPDEHWQSNDVDFFPTRASLDNQIVLLKGAGLILCFVRLAILVRVAATKGVHI